MPTIRGKLMNGGFIFLKEYFKLNTEAEFSLENFLPQLINKNF